MDLIDFHRRCHCRGGDCCPPLPANEGFMNDDALEDWSDAWGDNSISILSGDSWEDPFDARNGNDLPLMIRGGYGMSDSSSDAESDRSVVSDSDSEEEYLCDLQAIKDAARNAKEDPKDRPLQRAEQRSEFG